MKKALLVLVAILFSGCASQLEKTHTLKHSDGRTVECTEPGNASMLAGGILAKSAWDKEYQECMEKAKAQGFVEQAQK